MTSKRDYTAEAYFAVIALLESPLLSSERRRELERLRERLEKEMMTELNKSDGIAAD